MCRQGKALLGLQCCVQGNDVAATSPESTWRFRPPLILQVSLGASQSHPTVAVGEIKGFA